MLPPSPLTPATGKPKRIDVVLPNKMVEVAHWRVDSMMEITRGGVWAVRWEDGKGWVPTWDLRLPD